MYLQFWTSKESKQVSQSLNISYGVNLVSSGISPTQSLSCVSRYKGCIAPCADFACTSDVLAIFDRGSALSDYGPILWPAHSSSSFYKGVSPSAELVKGPGSVHPGVFQMTCFSENGRCIRWGKTFLSRFVYWKIWAALHCIGTSTELGVFRPSSVHGSRSMCFFLHRKAFLWEIRCQCWKIIGLLCVFVWACWREWLPHLR